MLALNFFPLLHIGLIIAVLLTGGPLPVRGALALAILFLLPPLLARTVRAFIAIPQGTIALNTNAFIAWWAMAQFQAVFNRFPFLEELLRIVPGLYSAWLRLWGAKIGRLTFWAPGTTLLDRSFLDIGDNVVFGMGVRLNGHVILKNGQRQFTLALADIKIGDGATVGGYSLLTAGTEIAPGETTKASTDSPPFTIWKDGRRIITRQFVEILGFPPQR
jgi:acetyltransferase-like isoleucine patch superfamily enzyme